MSEFFVGNVLYVNPADFEASTPFVVLVPAIKIAIEVNLMPENVELAHVNTLSDIQ